MRGGMSGKTDLIPKEIVTDTETHSFTRQRLQVWKNRQRVRVKEHTVRCLGKRFSLDCTYMVFTLCSSLLGHFSMRVLIASRRSTAEDDASLLTAGCLVETGRNLYSVTVMLFLCVFPSLKSPLSLSSYHAVQGWMEELKVDEGKAGELALVDVGDDQLVRRGENGLGTREKLVKVFCSFAALKEMEKGHQMQKRVSYLFDHRAVKSWLTVTGLEWHDERRFLAFIRKLHNSPRGRGCRKMSKPDV